MREKYLGDSFDLVKRFWADSLSVIAPLMAHDRFIPKDLRARYSLLISMPIYDPASPPAARFGLLLDPHTGIPVPEHKMIEATIEHAPLAFIVRELRRLRPAYMVCFDQGNDWRHELDAEAQRESKRAYLSTQGIPSFYYRSHAPFLFLANTEPELRTVRERLIAVGIPESTSDGCRLQDILPASQSEQP